MPKNKKNGKLKIVRTLALEPTKTLVKKPNTFVAWLKNNASIFSVSLITLGLTVFIFMNAAEVFYNIDLPVVQSVVPMRNQSAINTLIDDFQKKGGQDTGVTVSAFNAPENLYIRSLGVKFAVTNQRVIDGQYYARPSTGQYVIMNRDSEGRPGDILIYAKVDWRTIPYPENITKNTFIELETVNAVSTLYQVREYQVFASTDRYVATGSNTRQIVILLENNSDDTYTIIRAESTTN